MSETIGSNIINQNLPVILDSIDKYYAFSDKILSNKEKRIDIIEVEDSVTYDQFVLEECNLCFNEVKKDGTNLDRKNFTEFKIKDLSAHKIDRYNLELIKPKKGFYDRKTIEIGFSNFYINRKGDQCFFTVEKRPANSKGTTVEIYFFEKVNGNWKFKTRHKLMNG
ncbi:hypothetical protein ACQWU4_09900 [Chryseobacterium sp. MIQD13]|uniref:hypothetical protein n=1 Tax=Chryseobacterium sp. MIQD13 TaxID=3422310 RepID=UPI003D26CFD6